MQVSDALMRRHMHGLVSSPRTCIRHTSLLTVREAQQTSRKTRPCQDRLARTSCGLRAYHFAEFSGVATQSATSVRARPFEFVRSLAYSRTVNLCLCIRRRPDSRANLLPSSYRRTQTARQLYRTALLCRALASAPVPLHGQENHRSPHLCSVATRAQPPSTSSYIGRTLS